MKTSRPPTRRARSKSSSQKGLRPYPRGPKSPVRADKVELLRRSFSLLERQAGIAGLVFYRNLFALDPSLRPLFQSSIELQARKLMDSLGYTIATLESPKTLTPVLEAMGRRHVSYGTRPEHYDTVIAALLRTFDEVLNSAFPPEVRAAWKEALSFVADTMKRGAAETEALRGD